MRSALMVSPPRRLPPASANRGPVARPRSEATRGRIGATALTRLAEALTAGHGACVCHRVFAAAGQAHRLDQPPRGMIEDAAVARLHCALVDRLGVAAAAAVGAEAGRLAAEHLLANRIPRPVQRLLRLLPGRISAAILVRVIARQARSFAGSGQFSFRFADGLTLRLAGGPVSRLLTTGAPSCHFYAASFERVFAAMLGPLVRVRELQCEAAGAPACVFSVAW